MTPEERMAQAIYCCTYCGQEKYSHNGLGSDVLCCGEVGHVEKVMPEESDGPTGMARTSPTTGGTGA